MNVRTEVVAVADHSEEVVDPHGIAEEADVKVEEDNAEEVELATGMPAAVAQGRSEQSGS